MSAPPYLGSDLGRTIVQFLPPAASTLAPRVDALLWWTIGLFGVTAMALTGLILYFMVRYRRGARVNRDFHITKKRELRIEFGWSFAVFIAFLAFFYAGAVVYVDAFSMPAQAIRIAVTGKQWMWKFEHPNGAREINTLHVPLNRYVELDMTSTDVIHDVDIPAFRIRYDVLPGTHTHLWFEATRIGSYDLFCNQFCGLGHSKMRGRVIVMKQSDYADWLNNQQAGSAVAAGAALFRANGCSGCHVGNAAIHAPPLAGIYGRVVHLADGRERLVNDAYLRDSILFPAKDIVAGYRNDMPSFRGQLSEGEIQRIVAYVKSMKPDYRDNQ